ncbi:hypothetical protein HPB51_000194 [Rhipicephalus microplus]|uniref:Uncharacterized protein n=1 Tax=Rhipicephalus microplus TaxID=6941 RepID=A0A9J6DYV4_RHIMP|nr:hypothetical protein HPB51_000194 [Rhipicephalus microplus]
MPKRSRAASSVYQTPGVWIPRVSIKPPAERNIEEIMQNEMIALEANRVPEVRRVVDELPREIGGGSGGGGSGGGGSPIPELFVPDAPESDPTVAQSYVLRFISWFSPCPKLLRKNERGGFCRTRTRSTQRTESHATDTTKGEVTWLTQATTPAPTTSTTTPQPLLCSVSETATLVSLYPDDNLCDIVMYTHVRASKNQIVAVDDMDSYTTFTTVCGVKYSKTTCGISFDAR